MRGAKGNRDNSMISISIGLLILVMAGIAFVRVIKEMER